MSIPPANPDPDPACSECGRKTYLLDAAGLCTHCVRESADINHQLSASLLDYITPTKSIAPIGESVMATCVWCKTTNKTLVVDKEGVCQACRKAAQYPAHRAMKHLGLDEDGNLVVSAGRRTFPVGEFFPDKDDED